MCAVVTSAWNRIAVLYSEDAYGRGLHSALRAYRNDHAPLLGWLSAPFSPEPSKIADSLDAAMTTIKQSGTLIIIAIGTSDSVATYTSNRRNTQNVGKQHPIKPRYNQNYVSVTDKQMEAICTLCIQTPKNPVMIPASMEIVGLTRFQ